MIRKGISQHFTDLLKQLTKPDLIIYLKTDYDVIQKRILNSDMSTNDPLFLTERMCNCAQNMYRKVFDSEYVVVENNDSLQITKSQVQNALQDHAAKA